MNVNNLSQKLTLVGILAMQEVAADQTSNTGVDMRSYVGEAAFILSAKNTAGTTPTLDIKLQESDAPSSGFTDITGGAFTQVTDANTLAAVKYKLNINLDSTKRYVRAYVDIGGTDTPKFIVSLTALAATGQ